MSATQTNSEKAHLIHCRFSSAVFQFATTAKGAANAPGFFQAIVNLEDDENFWLENRTSEVSTVLAAIKARRGEMVKAMWALYAERKNAGLPVTESDLVLAYKDKQSNCAN